MRYYHGNGQNKRYFEGWYFKHQSDKTVVAFIPGLSIDSDGNKSAFIQVITPEMSCNFLYLSVAVIKCRKVAVKKCMFMAVRNDI